MQKNYHSLSRLKSQVKILENSDFYTSIYLFLLSDEYKNDMRLERIVNAV